MAGQMLKLVANQVKVGSPLPFGVRDEHGKLLLARGQMVDSDGQLAALLLRGLFVDIEEIKTLKAGASADAADARRRTLFDLWEQSVARLERLLKSATPAEPGFAARCDEFANQIMALVSRDIDVAIYLSMRQNPRRLYLYGLTHSLHTALVCQLMASRSGWDTARARTLVKAALTMNISITELQGRFAVMGRISEAQRAQISLHPLQGVAMLRAAGVDDEVWLQAVAEHHERPGGGGYPAKLQAPGELAGVLGLADVFMAKISPRAERSTMPIQDAARQMFQESKGSAVAAAIIKEYGIYPPGDFVQLASGELAVVIRRGATAHTPLAAAITDKAGMPMVNTVRRDTAQAAYAITGPARDKSLVVRVPPERLFGLAE